MDATPLCPAPLEVQLEQVTCSSDTLVVRCSAHRHVVRCPRCGHASTRVHSRYHRRLGDLPWHGLRVRLELTVRKFFCDLPGCSQRIFTERLPGTAAPYARHTIRAAAALEAIGFAVGGRPGARLAQVLGLTAGAAAMLSRVRRAAESALPTPRVLGVDDWALRRGSLGVLAHLAPRTRRRRLVTWRGYSAAAHGRERSRIATSCTRSVRARPRWRRSGGSRGSSRG